MSITIDCHGESHVGQRRPSNEDQFLIADLNKSMRVHQTSLGLNHQTRLFGGSQGKLLLVADGLGGHESGERASTLAVDGVTHYILNAMDWVFQLGHDSEENFELDLRKAFRHSQKTLQIEADAIPQRRGMATTLTMAYVDWPNFYVVHVGDTRCYHIRENQINCLTTDHTFGELARLGGVCDVYNARASSDDCTQQTNPMDHVLYNVIGGTDASLDPQVSRSELTVDDALLLCSDGLTRYLSDEEILKSVRNRDESAKKICQSLVDEANRRGGSDNITAVLAKFSEDSPNVEGCEYERVDESVPSENDTSKFISVQK